MSISGSVVDPGSILGRDINFEKEGVLTFSLGIYRKYNECLACELHKNDMRSGDVFKSCSLAKSGSRSFREREMTVSEWRANLAGV